MARGGLCASTGEGMKVIATSKLEARKMAMTTTDRAKFKANLPLATLIRSSL
jgi:hypothetical protein